MMRQINYVVPVAVFNATLAADNTPAAIDLQGFDGAKLLIQVGAGGITFDATNKVEFKITHSDDDSTYTAVAAADVILGTNADSSVGTGGIVKSLVAAHATADITSVDYIGGKRYLKVLADFSGTHGTGTPICVTVVKGRAARTA
jgi:hypothetical protein